MNHWKVVWDAYSKGATRRAFFRELWRLAGWKLRVGAFICMTVSIWGLLNIRFPSPRDLTWLTILGEIGFLAILFHVREETFRREYGSTDNSVSPSENEDYRASRYLMFRATLRANGITKSHVHDLFDVLAAKDELEAQRNGILNRFWVFASGFLSATALSLIRGAEDEQQIYILFGLLGACVLVAPLLWLTPSRKERMKELKYFLVLYGKVA